MGAAALARRSSYAPPPVVQVLSLGDLLLTAPIQRTLVTTAGTRLREATLYLAGDASLVSMPAVAIVGARSASPEGLRRAARLARELVAAKVLVVSGLAEGIDTAAHRSAIEHGGRTLAVIGTPLDRVFPPDNASLQEEIYRHHLLISRFPSGAPVGASNFPERNKVMAALADATVIIEASDTSGTLHQAAECARLGRALFIAKSVVDNRSLQWPAKFLAKPATHVLEKTEDILRVLPCRR